jgi:MFS family permease
MILLVDFVARGLGRGAAAGAQCWVLFGLSAIVGPLIAGRLGDRVGFAAAMRLALAIQAVGVGLLAVCSGPASVAVSSIVVGAFVPGVVPLALGRVHELVPHHADLQRRAWVWCTIAFALGQAAAAYGVFALFVRTGGFYPVLFALGAVALIVALGIDLLAATTRRRAGRGRPRGRRFCEGSCGSNGRASSSGRSGRADPP